MMAVFLKILAIIGIVLLSILGLILLAVLLVLLVPVRYKADGAFKDNKPTLTAKGSWLLHVVSVIYTLGEENPLVIKIFGIKLKSKAKSRDLDGFDDDFSENSESPSVSPAEVKPEQTEDVAKETVNPVKAEVKAEETPLIDNSSLTSQASEADIKPEDTDSAKADSKSDNNKKSDSPNKDFENHGFYDKIKKYIEIIESRRFKRAFEFTKDKIFKLLKHICPGKLTIDGEVGFDDPSVTGQILVITSALKPIFSRNVRIVGNFEEPIISIEGRLKGHITVLRVLWTGAVLYFNKDIKKIIKMFREV